MPRWALLLACGVALGCGGNVVVDSAGGGVGGSGGSATTGGGGATSGTGLTCAGLLDVLPPSSHWEQNLPASSFASGTSYMIYVELETCACTTLLSAGGCADVCAMGLNGTSTPNFCDGAGSLTQCDACLSSNCSSALTACASN